MHYSKFFLLVFVLCFLGSQALYAQQRQHALLIGINKYAPPSGKNSSQYRSDWIELDGPVNDLRTVRNLIQSKYNFAPANIDTLTDQQATRQNILNSLENLLNRSNKGDIAFVYYAGHGSQVYNSASYENDRKDESIVPADAWKPGIEDIRDKTLAGLWNRFVDKGVILTCIFDCCHSGSIGKGFQNRPPKYRFLESPDYDAKDSSNPVAPELRPNSNFLIFSACQDIEGAIEFQDEYGAYGAFTNALIQATYQQNTDDPVYTLFSTTSAILSTRIKQAPVLAGDQNRFRGTLFGIRSGALPNKNLVTAIFNQRRKKIMVQGGFLMGLSEGNELSSTNGHVKLKIIKVIGPGSSEAELTSGTLEDLKAVSLFEIVNWVSTSLPSLRLYVPSSTLSITELTKVAATAKKVTNLVSDFEKEESNLSIYYYNNKWRYTDPKKGEIEINNFSVNDINRIAQKKKVNINIPPGVELLTALNKKFENVQNIKIVGSPAEADYTLYGTPGKNNVAYCIVKMQVAPSDSLGMMPQQTKYFELEGTGKSEYDKVVDSIYEYSLRLSKIKAWLTLQSPKSQGFKAHLELRNDANDRLDTVQSGLRIGDKVSLYLVLDDDFEQTYNRRMQYVYCFSLDRHGNMEPLYPRASSGSVDNKFPQTDENGNYVRVTNLAELEAVEPAGTDNYFLLTSDQPINNHSIVMRQEGVRGTKGAVSNDPLTRLLGIGNETRTRSAKVITPATWSLSRLSIKTHY